MGSILLVGEMMLDKTVYVRPPTRVRTIWRRSDPIIYERAADDKIELGGVFYLARFLREFSDVSVVFPRPDCGVGSDMVDGLLKEAQQPEPFSVKGVEVQREIFMATRILEAEHPKLERDATSTRRSVLRIDSGDAGRMKQISASKFIDGVRDVVASWQRSGNGDCIILADYDLGLFSHEMIGELGRVLPEGVPIVVYCGRAWKDFADLLPCSIVCEWSECVAQLASWPSGHEEDEIAKNPFRYIAMQFPKLEWVVLVGTGNVKATKWSIDSQAGAMKGVILTKDSGSLYPRTPSGFRALVSCWLALQIGNKCAGTEKTSWFVQSVDIAGMCHHAVLTGRISDAHRKDLEHKLEDADKEAAVIEKWEVGRKELLYHQLSADNLVLDLRNAKTEVSGVYSRDLSYRSSLQKIITRIGDQTLAPSTLKGRPPHLLLKLLIKGPSRIGKTTLAKAIAFATGVPRSKVVEFPCNEQDPKLSAKEVAEKMLGVIRKSSSGAVIFDEIDKMGTKGREIQSYLLRFLDDLDPKAKGHPTSKRTLVVFICSLDGMKARASDKKNLRDFYLRLEPGMLVVPPLQMRYWDVVYSFCEMLYRLKIRRAWLDGILEIGSREWGSMSMLRQHAEAVATKAKGEDATKESFEQGGIAVKAFGQKARYLRILE